MVQIARIGPSLTTPPANDRIADSPIRRLLLPLDGSARCHLAVNVAARLAQQTAAAIELVTIHDPVDGDFGQKIDAVAQRLTRRHHIDQVEVNLVGAGVPAEVIVGMAREVPGTVVCMATRSRSGLEGLLFGGVTRQVIRQTTTPLLLIGPTFDPATATTPTIVAALDGSPTAHATLPIAGGVARQLHAQLHLLHVNTTSSQEAVGAKEQWMPTIAHDLQTGGCNADWRIIHAPSAAEGIVAHATQMHASILVMATHERATLARLAVGSVTETVVRTSPTPVLLIPTQSPTPR